MIQQSPTERAWKSTWQQLDAATRKGTGDEGEDGYNMGRRDGFSEAVQAIDMLTGGDGEYRYCTVSHDRHCPDPDAMITRIVARVDASQVAQPAEADGWVMVPREGSDEIALAIVHELQQQASWLGWEPHAIWKAALAATPKAPATDAGEEKRVHLVRWVSEAAERADKHGNIEGVWLFAHQWRIIAAALATPPAPNDDLRAENERLRKIVQVVADADSEDAVGSLDVDIPSGRYPRQWLRDAARAALKENRRG